MTSNETTTVDINGNILEADQLLAGYRELLEMAKQQLESLELSEDQFQKIFSSLISQTRSDTNMRILARHVAYLLFDALKGQTDPGLANTCFDSPDEHAACLMLVDALASVVLDKIKSDTIRDMISLAVSREMEESRKVIDSKIEAAVERYVSDKAYRELDQAGRERDALAMLMQNCVGSHIQELVNKTVAAKLSISHEETTIADD